jgi:hypothetical protein
VVKAVKRIDQIYCQVESIGDVNKLYYLFANTLGFPEAWPPTDKKTYYGGGVYTGNTWLKWTTPNIKSYPMTIKPARFNQIQAEPTEYNRSLKDIEKRGITHDADRISTSKDSSGIEREWCRSSRLTGTPFKEIDLGLCKYSPFAFSEYTSTPKAVDLQEHYSILRARLDEMDGGPLGVRYVREVELGVKDVVESMADWQVLLDPIKPISEDTWKIGTGPTLRLTPDKDYGIKSISVKVRSLRRAKKFLKMNGLLGEEKEGMLALNRGRVNNLDIRFVK